MTLWTLNEAQQAVVASATALIDQASCDTAQISFLLWGAGSIEGLPAADRSLGMRHQAVLDNMIELGYAAEAVDELEGIASAAGLDEDGDDYPLRCQLPWSLSPRPSS